jgi:chromosome segregation ATPase
MAVRSGWETLDFEQEKEEMIATIVKKADLEPDHANQAANKLRAMTRQLSKQQTMEKLKEAEQRAIQIQQQRSTGIFAEKAAPERSSGLKECLETMTEEVRRLMKENEALQSENRTLRAEANAAHRKLGSMGERMAKMSEDMTNSVKELAAKVGAHEDQASRE